MSQTSRHDHPQPPIKRWTAKRKSAIVLDILKGKTTAAEIARQYDLTVSEIEEWKARFLDSAEEGLRTNPRDAKAKWEAEKKNLYAKIGELTLDIEILKKTEDILRREEEDGTW